MTSGIIAIEIKNLSKIYKGCEKPALDNVNLSIGKGHIFGLLGPNGAGKTTMIRILSGLLSASSGDALVHGFSVRSQMPSVRRLLGVVPQDIALYPSLTARENLLVFGGICGLKGRILQQRMDELIPVFGLEKNLHTRVSRFSGGMKRRLNLLTGLLHAPEILFLDEPTVGVDVQSKNVIIENLVNTHRSGMTIIYTSHYLEEAENLCTHIAIMDEGRIIAQGSPDEIKKAGEGYDSLENVFLSLTGKSVRD
jgi:ABC-2 type transport system ATP-binding protein